MAAHESRAGHWRDIVHVRSRYQRSVHLERDAHERGSLDGYILTPLVRTLTGRIVQGYNADARARAFSVTGPYGTGKSAFAVFLADVLSPPDLDASGSARRLLQHADAPLAGALSEIFGKQQGLCPVLATGERRSLDQVLLRALRDFTQRFWSGPGKKPALLARVQKLAEAAEKGRDVPPRDVVDLFEQAAKQVAESKGKQQGRGLVVVLDEAGKVLEHAAQHPEHGDVQLLQELAESAHRSGDHPIVFVVVLHQAFEEYAGRLSLTERSEWAKVQGRFEDLAFQEASHELLRLVGEAIESRPLPKPLRKALEPLPAAVSALVTRGAQDPKKREEQLAAAFPLHPVTTLLLGPLFRSRLAQNERSLFAFLSSIEPFGFQQFLDTPVAHGDRPSLFLPDALHDYVVAALGSRIHGHLGKQWAQIETALRRLPEGAGDLEARLVKTLGLLGLFGDAAGLAASDATLATLYTDGTEASHKALADALERLRRASLIIFRKYRNAYQLWEGSDLDVDALVRDALTQIDATATLVQRLSRVAPPRPIVARRHLFETGTFRYFDLRYVDVSIFDEAVPEVDRNADGALLLVIEPDAATRAKFIKQLQQPMTWTTAGAKPILVAVPRHVGRLLELGGELGALEWVQTHTPELQDDLVSSREVSTRIAEAERQLRAEIARLLGGAIACDWLTRDKAHEVESARALARLISDLSDSAYSKAPIVQNELLNRRQLSSAAAAARRTLLEAMVTRGAEPGLGFEGTPPEVSMYRSLLEAHRIHKDRDGGWSFGEPIHKKHGSLKPAWEEIGRALGDAQEARLRVPVLYERLRQPPFGLKDGVLPVLLVAAMLAFKDEVALYREGVFVPRISGDVIDALVTAPEKIEVQRIAVEGARAALYSQLSEILSIGQRADHSGIIPVVRALARTVRELPPYARTTQSVSPSARAVRDVLLRAKEPGPLLFTELPRACGHAPFTADGSVESGGVARFVEDLRSAVRELRLAFPLVLDRIEELLSATFGSDADFDSLRSALAARADAIIPICADPKLRALLAHAGEAQPREEWLATAGAIVQGKHPSSWQDIDLEHLPLALGLLRRRFTTLVALTSPHAPGRPEDRLHCSVAISGQPERSLVIDTTAAPASLVEALSSEVRSLATQPGVSADILIAALSQEIASLFPLREDGAGEVRA